MPVKKRIKIKDRLSGFTMVELLIVIAIFSIIIAIGSTRFIITYIGGHPNSGEKGMINNEMIYVSQMMRQFMSTADTKVKVGAITINGFSILNSEGTLIVFASDDNRCNYIGFDQGTRAIYALQETCNKTFKIKQNVNVDTSIFQRLTQTDLDVKSFNANYIDPANVWEGFTWQLVATNLSDTKNSNQMTIKNTYTLGYEQYQNILNQ